MSPSQPQAHLSCLIEATDFSKHPPFCITNSPPFPRLCRQVAIYFILKKCTGLPLWRSGLESTCRCRGHGFEPWSGKVPHAAEPLSPCATTTEPAL